MSDRTSDSKNDQPASENFRKLPIAGDRLNENPSRCNQSPSSLNENQLTAIGMLILGKSIAEVAQAVGVSPRTLYTWRQDPDFQEELERRRAELWSDAAERLRAMVHASLDIFQEHLGDPYDRARFRAANAVLRISDLRRVVPPAKASAGG